MSMTETNAQPASPMVQPADYTRLRRAWRAWGWALGGPGAAVSTSCDDCSVLFSAPTYQAHLRADHDERSWVLDIVEYDGRRRDAVARFSGFALAERYLIWDWATTASPALLAGPLGMSLYRKGFADVVEVAEHGDGYRISRRSTVPGDEGDEEWAVLDTYGASIFSHLMCVPTNDVEHAVVAGGGYSGLALTWMDAMTWVGLADAPGTEVSTACPDCWMSFSCAESAFPAFHVHNDDGWWVVDTVDASGERNSADAQFSSPDLLRRYLTWRWLSFAASYPQPQRLDAAGSADDYADGVAVAQLESDYVKLRIGGEYAILPAGEAMAFSHLS